MARLERRRRRGAGYGYSGVKGINALVATVSTPLSAPVIAATRLRKGSSNSSLGAFRLVADAVVGSTASIKILRDGRPMDFKLAIVSSSESSARVRR